MKGLLQRFVAQQVSWSAAVDGLLPQSYRLDGNRFFIDSFYGRFLRSGQVVVDVGGGKQPLISAEQKRAFGLTVIGFDISAAELGAAPAGRYDECICADITDFRGTAQADIVICQALLEHVPSTERAFRAIGSLLKPGGLALIFAPSRNAVFARLNLLLPQRLKRAILFAVFPQTRHAQGFVSYYDRCTPRDFEAMARAANLEVVERHFFFRSAYFTFFVPLHVLWRLWVALFRGLRREQAAETFVYAFRKRAAGAGGK